MSNEGTTPETTGTTNSSPPSTDTQNTGKITRNGPNSNRTDTTTTTRNNGSIHADKHFCGNNPNIGAVLGLKTEKIDKKVSFDVFREKLANYVLVNLKDAEDVMPLIEEQVDPRIDFRTNNKPASLTEEQKKDDVDVMIQSQYLKIFATREFAIKDSMNKVYGMLWGQCTHSLQCVIKNGTDFKVDNKSKNAIWLWKSYEK